MDEDSSIEAAFFEAVHILVLRLANTGVGKKTALRAKMLAERGADTIAFASCMQKGRPSGTPVPLQSICWNWFETQLVRVFSFWTTHMEIRL